MRLTGIVRHAWQLHQCVQIPWVFVIARNSAFAYKGLSIDVRKVGRDLGVRYVLEGIVRRSGQRLRVTGQLIDAETGVHIWAERYDGTDRFGRPGKGNDKGKVEGLVGCTTELSGAGASF